MGAVEGITRIVSFGCVHPHVCGFRPFFFFSPFFLFPVEVYVLDLESLSQKLESRDSFPSLPEVLSDVIHEIDAENISMEALARLIQKDVSFSAQLVRQANCGMYAEAGHVSTVVQAVRLLGFRMLKGFCLTLPIFSRYRNVSGIADLWYHCQAASACAGIVSRHVTGVEKEEAETAGLLHDLGKVFLILEMRSLTNDLHQTASDPLRSPDWREESEHLGINHCFVGARYGRMFNFPGSILDPILWHHEPQKAIHNKELTHVCCLGDQIATIVGAVHGDFLFVEPVLLHSLDYLGIRPDRFSSILEHCLEVVCRISPIP
jgi:HD-like signal output (HDOD) protein